ncbi:MAG: pitrilysin family protein [Acidobacteriota bacterium]
MKSHQAISIFLCLCFGVAAAARAQDLLDLDVDKFTLTNGLEVVLWENHNLPKVSVNIVYDVGSKNEKPGRTGFAHLFEHMMFQGSEHHNTDYFEPLNKIGAVVNGGTTEDWTMYWQDVPSEYLELALWLESDRMGFLLPALTQERLDNQRDVVKNERRQNYENRPYAKSSLLLADLIYPANHPYSWPVIGSQADLSAATLDDVSEFFRQYYTPNNASLVIAGDFDSRQARSLVEKYFGSIPPGPSVDRVERWIPVLESERRAVAEDDVDLPRLYYTWHTSPHYAPGDAEFDLLSSILSDGKSSRLFKSLVYDKQIAQNVIAAQSSYQLVSEFQIVVTAREGTSLEEIASVVDEEIARLLDGGVTQEELDLARADWEARFVRRLENVGGFYGVAGTMNFYNTFLGDPNKFDWDMSRYREATVESINTYARRFLQPERRAVLEIRPRGSVAAGTDESVDRSLMPAPSAETTFTPPTILRDSLDNGLEVLVVQNRRLPLVQANLVVKSGWMADSVENPGAATLVAAMLDEGTQSRSALEISDQVRAIAADLSTAATFDGSFIRLNVLEKYLDSGLELVADMALNPKFSAEELDRQRKSYLGDFDQYASDPAARSRRALMAAIYGADHPYAELMWRPVRGGALYYGYGTRESVAAMTRAQLVDFYQTYYRPNNAALIFVGDIDLDEARSKAETYFGDWKAGNIPAEANLDPEQVSGTRIILVDKPNAPQSMIVAGRLGMQYGDPDLPAMELVQHVVGGGFQRLDMNLREDKGFTYGVGLSMWTDRQRGPMYVIAPVQSQSTKESIIEIRKELEALVSDRPIDSEELADAKATLVKRFPGSFESIGSIASNLEEVVLQGLADDAWKSRIEAWQAVTVEEINAAAERRIDSDDLVFVVVGDLGTIETAIRDLDIGEVSVVESLP